MMEVVTNKINNDVEVQIINTNKFKFVNIQLSFMANLDYQDIAAYNILAHLLVTRNSKYQSINSFSSYLENNYGMLITSNYFNRGNVAIFQLISSCINSKYSLNENLLLKQVETIKDCLFSPCLTIDALEETKMIYIQRLKEQLNKKTYILQKKVNEVFGNDNPYGVNIESSIAEIEKVDLDKLKQVYQKLIESSCKIYVCGEINNEELMGYFSSFNLHHSQQFLLDLSYLKHFEKMDDRVYESKFLQSAIILTYECDINYNDKLFYALKLFLEMFNYDLFNIIREEHNFCYYIYAISNNYLNTIEIISEIDSKNLKETIALIEKIISSYQTDFNSERFEICKDKILTYIKTTLDSPRDLIDLYFGFDFSKVATSIEELMDSYKKVSADEVKEVSQMIALKLVSILKEATNNG